MGIINLFIILLVYIANKMGIINLFIILLIQIANKMGMINLLIILLVQIANKMGIINLFIILLVQIANKMGSYKNLNFYGRKSTTRCDSLQIHRAQKRTEAVQLSVCAFGSDCRPLV
jgi:hypothetical protein